jgi:uracil-DNA glycosylase
MDSDLDFWTAKALLDWQIEMGADEAIRDAPLNRYALNDTPARPAQPAAAPPDPITATADASAIAARAANAATDLPSLAAAMQAFDLCDLKRGARNFVFADGLPAARVMIVGEAPGAEEDREGLPFVGRAGQLLDRMLDAIGLSRRQPDPGQAVYITNVLPWRPPSNRTPERPEIELFLPFLERHITLAQPDVLVLMGNTPCQALMGRAGITRIRGQWAEVLGRPALPMFHPADLLRNPTAKREAWADLLALKARLTSQP